MATRENSRVAVQVTRAGKVLSFINGAFVVASNSEIVTDENCRGSLVIRIPMQFVTISPAGEEIQAREDAILAYEDDAA